MGFLQPDIIHRNRYYILQRSILRFVQKTTKIYQRSINILRSYVQIYFTARKLLVIGWSSEPRVSWISVQTYRKTWAINTRFVQKNHIIRVDIMTVERVLANFNQGMSQERACHWEFRKECIGLSRLDSFSSLANFSCFNRALAKIMIHTYLNFGTISTYGTLK